MNNIDYNNIDYVIAGIIGGIGALNLIGLVILYLYIRRHNKRFEKLELAVVSDVMEQDGVNVQDRVLKAYDKLSSGMCAEPAMREARRLYGLPP